MTHKVDKVPLAQASQYQGMWVALNKNKEVIAASRDLDGISELVIGTKKYPPKATAFFLPEKGHLKPIWKSDL